MAIKRCNLEVRLVTADVGWTMALGTLKEGVAWLMALERELREKAMG